MKTTALKIEISDDRDCILVEASLLSLNDKFMRYKPRTVREEKFKELLTEVIKTGIEDFYKPKMDPSFVDETKTKIHFIEGEKPAVDKSYNWWENAIKDSKYCFGTKSQYVAFLGVLIKMLVAKGWKHSKAWDAVCNSSEKLGHYWDSYNAKHQFEDTGSREVCGFFDLANTYKILAKDEDTGSFWLAGGYYNDNGNRYPLADLTLDNDYYYAHYRSTAWLVINK